jgi:hypothetical protein
LEGPFLKQVAIALLVCGVLVGCSTASPNPSASPAADPHRYTELAPGMTKDEVVAKLGPPNSFSDLGTIILLQWSDYDSPHPIHLAVQFGKDGKMTKIQSVFVQ